MSKATSVVAVVATCVLVAGALAWAMLAKTGGHSQSTACPAMPRSEALESNARELVEFSFGLQSQSLFKYVGDRGSTAPELRSKLQSVEKDMPAARRGIVYLLAKSVGPNDSPAIAVRPADKRPFACFLRIGDVVMLRGYVTHWVTVSDVDLKAGVVHFLDSWPDRFPFLKTHSSGEYDGKLVKRTVGVAVEMPFDQVNQLLHAILTTDGPEFALELTRADCACIHDSASLAGVFDTLLDKPDTARLQMVVQFASALGPTVAPALLPTAEAYEAAASLLQGFLGAGSEASVNRVAEIVEKYGNDCFIPLSPLVSLQLFAAIERGDDRLGDIVTHTVNVQYIEKRFSPYQQTVLEYFRGQHFAADGKEGVAIDYLKFAVRKLDEWWTARTAVQPTTGDESGLDPSVRGADTYEMFKLVVEGRAALAVYYSRQKNPRAAANHFHRLLDLKGPYPISILLNTAQEICKHDPKALAMLKTINPARPVDDIKSRVQAAMCLPAASG